MKVHAVLVASVLAVAACESDRLGFAPADPSYALAEYYETFLCDPETSHTRASREATVEIPNQQERAALGVFIDQVIVRCSEGSGEDPAVWQRDMAGLYNLQVGFILGILETESEEVWARHGSYFVCGEIVRKQLTRLVALGAREDPGSKFSLEQDLAQFLNYQSRGCPLTSAQQEPQRMELFRMWNGLHTDILKALSA